jgi:serine protease Do
MPRADRTYWLRVPIAHAGGEGAPAMTSQLSLFRPSPAAPPKSRRRWAGLLAFGLAGLIVVAPVPAAVSPAAARVAPESFADLAQQLLPSVVNISTTQTVEGSAGIELPKLPPGSPFEEFFKEFMEKNQPRQQKRKATSLGSGYIIDPKGYIVTNNHVIQDAEEITVILHDETRLPAKIIGRDAKTDIAVLKVEPGNLSLPAVKFGDSDAIRVGDWVVAIGNPFGFGGTVTAGIISARGRNINAGPYDDFLQTDASINRGNSGGPVFNLAGEVVGMATAIFSPSGGSIGIGFAIPASTVKPVIQQLIEHGEVRRGWLGVRIQQVNEEIAEALGLKEATGALVASVIAGGPAEKAKIKDGDVILEFDGKPVDQMRRLPRLVADTDVGKTVPVKIWRSGKEMTLKVEVGALKEEEEEKQASVPPSEKGKSGESIDDLGVTVAAIDPQLRDRFDLGQDAKGVVVTDVNPDGPAAEQGLRAGETIVEIGQENVATPAQLAQKVKTAKELGRKSVLLLVEGEGGLRFVAIRLTAKG